MRPAEPSGGRRLAFRIVAGVLGVLGIALSVPFTVISFLDDEQSIHQLHNLASVGLYALLLGAALVACARRPESNRSPFFVAAASGVAGATAGLLSGDFVSGGWVIAPISIAILWWLHPERDRLLPPGALDLPTSALAVAAFIPAILYAVGQAELQRNGVAGDPHWEFHHYSGMAAAAIGLSLCGLAAAIRTSGRRLGGWLVGTSALLLAAGSLLLSDHAGALEPLWAWLTVAWGVAIVVVVSRDPTTEATAA
jgi:hypothetical protein